MKQRAENRETDNGLVNVTFLILENIRHKQDKNVHRSARERGREHDT